MSKRSFCTLGILAILGITPAFAASDPAASPSITPATMPRLGSVDERFLSFNIEMLEVTGGRFWKPYNQKPDAQPAPPQSGTPTGMSADMYQYRPPLDLANPRLRKLANAVAPAYVRVSGTWANTTYFQDSDDPPSKTPPTGFNGVLTRQQWKGVIDFSRATNAKIITSFATSAGTRDAAGVWTPAEATKFLAYTRSIGGSIAAAEFMNEPTAAPFAGVPKGYDAASFGRDISVFVPFIRKTTPEMIILGPGSVGEGGTLALSAMPGFLKSEDLLRATGPVFDAFSYHFYGAVSKRCAAMGGPGLTTPEAALSDEWLSATDKVEAFYAELRDRFLPGKPIWLTETGESACGGNPWASTFLDSFRYLNQLGTLAQRGVQVVAHNTLDASDYALLDENNFAPRPNYWASLLWRKLMGTTVLNPNVSVRPRLYVYAHCLKDKPGGVAVLVINANSSVAQSLNIPTTSERYTLSAENLTGTQVKLNGHTLTLAPDDSLPPLISVPTKAGDLTLAPASITFFAIPQAKNASCGSGQ
jgi:heparanase 1